MEGRPTDERWICVFGEELTHESFGVTESGEKIKWVSPDMKWVKEKPTENFKLEFGGLEMSIVDRRPSPTIYSFIDRVSKGKWT